MPEKIKLSSPAVFVIGHVVKESRFGNGVSVLNNEEREDDHDDCVLNFDGKEETKMIAIGSASS